MQIHANNIYIQQQAANKQEALTLINDALVTNGITTPDYITGLLDREKEISTYLEHGIAIPHGTTATTQFIQQTGVVVFHFPQGIIWGANGELAYLVIGLAATVNEHLDILKKLTHVLDEADIEQKIQQIATKQDILNLFTSTIATTATVETTATNNMAKILAVTGCPTGVAHTYMAEEALKKAAAKLGVYIKVETNGAAGAENILTTEDIQDATAIIIAADKDVNAERFNGKPVIEVPVKEGITNSEQLVQRALTGNIPIRQGIVSTTNTESQVKESISRQVYKHLMSGVSNMLPFVVAGGVLIALSFLWGIHSANPDHPEQYNIYAATLMQIGGQAFGIMVPVFTAFIASSIAGRPGLVAGFVGGLMANVTGAGFLGGIVAGFAAGYLMLYTRQALSGLPRQFEALKSIFIMPLIGVFVIGVLMVLLGKPVSYVNESLKAWLATMQQANPILLGIILGCMCSFDFGGPVNKAAYVTGTILLAEGNYHFMAGVSAACIAPPFVIAFATTIFKKLFDEDERAAGIVNYVLGSTHITEGAIPFAAKDPLRVIPIMMISSSVAAVLTFIFNIEVPAPHGGFLILPLVSKPLLWVGCIFAGALVGAVLLAFVRMLAKKKDLTFVTK